MFKICILLLIQTLNGIYLCVHTGVPTPHSNSWHKSHNSNIYFYVFFLHKTISLSLTLLFIYYYYLFQEIQ